MFHRILPILLLAGLATPAAAHVTANPDNGIAGNYFQTSLRVSHGCDGKATTAIRVKFPDGIFVVHPQHKPGWNVVIAKRKLPQVVAIGHGKTTDEAVEEITWRGGPLPDDEYDDFGLVMKLPDQADKTLWFPTVQECEGGENKWVEIPAPGQQWHDVARPAPFVTLTGPAQAEHHH